MSWVSTDPSQAGSLILSKLKVRCFRSLYKVSLPLRRVNILVGPNGSGKSNLIMLFRFLHDVISEERVSPMRYGPRPQELIWLGPEEEGYSKRKSFGVTLYLDGPFGKPLLQYEISVAVDGDRLVFPLEQLTDRAGTVLFFREENRVTIRGRTYTAPLDQPYLRILCRQDGEEHGVLPAAESVYRFILGWRVPEIDPRLIRKSLSEELPSSPPDRVLPFQPDGGNLHEFLYALQEKDQEGFELIQERLSAAMEFVEGLRTAVRPTTLEPTRFWEFRERGLQEPFSPYAQSDGTLRFLAILALVLGDKTSSLVCLDEPAHNLHPWLMLHLADALRYPVVTGEPYPQIIVTTYKPDFLDCFDPTLESEYLQVFTVSRKETGETHFKPESPDDLKQWGMMYWLGELLKKGVIGKGE